MKSFKRQFIEKYVHVNWEGSTTSEGYYDVKEQELLEAIEKDDGWIKIEED